MQYSFLGQTGLRVIGLIPRSPLGMYLSGGTLHKVTSGLTTTPAMQQQMERLRPQLEA